MELFNVQQGQMAADWYRQTIQGLLPDFADGKNIFQGKDKEFSGLTSNALSGEYGAPTPITWKIRSNQKDNAIELIYTERRQESIILAWRSDEARFIYLDEEQVAYDSWPPPLGQFTQLPKQIQLVTKDAGNLIDIVASPMGPIAPQPRSLDYFGVAP